MGGWGVRSAARCCTGPASNWSPPSTPDTPDRPWPTWSARPARRPRRRGRPRTSSTLPRPAPKWSSTSPTSRSPGPRWPTARRPGIHAVVGTTGFTEDDLDELAELFAPGSAHGANCIVAANFAIGAVLMMRFAAMAAPWFDERRDHRAPPRGQAGRPVGHLAAHRRGHGRGPCRPRAGRVPGPTPPSTVVVEGARGGAGPGASGCTRCGCPAWWPTRRSCSAPPARG